jgi:hypothetical protein
MNEKVKYASAKKLFEKAKEKEENLDVYEVILI